MDQDNELLVVVDKNDKVIAYRTRQECHQDKNLIHRSVGVVIINNKGEVLLQKRGQAKDLYPGFYCVSCCGHVDKNESYKESARRELDEELGITKNLTLKFFKKFLVFFENETHMFTVFTAKDEGPFKIDSQEVETVNFFSRNRIKKLFRRNKLQLTPDTEKTLKELKIL